MEKSQKILLLGDYSNCHRALSAGLRSLGCDVTLASDGSKWMDCERDIDLSRKPGKLSGMMLYLKMHRLLRSQLSGFDVVAVNDPNFCLLRPELLQQLFNLLVKRNGSVFLTSMSTDIAYLDMLEASNSPLRYSEWFVDGKDSRYSKNNPEAWYDWHNKALISYQNNFFDRIDGAVSVLYEYQLGMERRLGAEKAVYGGLPIQTELFEPVEIPERPEKVRLFLGRDRNRKLQKGSDLLEVAARKVIERYPDKAELIIVENRSYAEFVELLRSAHVVLDQIYSYTPATTALMAMAYGIPTVSGAEPAFYDYIGEHDNQPIVNAPIDLDPLTKTLEELVLNSDKLRERGKRSREFVIKHNDSRVVARRFLEFWNERRAAKS